MATPLKLGTIEQEHLQELYEAAGVPRDDLPYSEVLAGVCQLFQDRTFKNADEGQVYGAIVKYVRSGRCSKGDAVKAVVSADRLEQAKLLRDHRPSGRKLQPYTAEFDAARNEFARKGGAELSRHEFWRVLRIAVGRATLPGGNGRTDADSPGPHPHAPHSARVTPDEAVAHELVPT